MDYRLDTDEFKHYRSPSTILIDGEPLPDVLDKYRKIANTNFDEEDDLYYISALNDVPDLCDLDLSKVNLSSLDFSFITLRNINFDGSALAYTVFSHAFIVDCTFNDTNMPHAIFHNTHILGCKFYNSSLQTSAFIKCTIRNNSFNSTIFAPATKFVGGVLQFNEFTNNIGAIQNSNLFDIDVFSNNISKSAYTSICPSHGGFIGWKVLRRGIASHNGKVTNFGSHPVLLKLYIPADAKRSSSTTIKCRCNKAKVLEMYTITFITTINKAELSKYTGGNSIDSPFNSKEANRTIFTKYTKGEYVYPDSFDEDRWNECSHGIHFFTDILSAINYGSYHYIYEYEFV